MTRLVDVPRFQRHLWWLLVPGMLLGLGLGAFGLALLEGVPPVGIFFLLAGLLMVGGVTVRILRNLGVLPLLRGKVVEGGYLVSSSIPVVLRRLEMWPTDRTRVFPPGSHVTVVEKVFGASNEAYFGPPLSVYELISEAGNARFPCHVRLGSRELKKLVTTLNAHDITVSLMIEGAEDDAPRRTSAVTEGSPYTSWIALPHAAGSIGFCALEPGADPHTWVPPQEIRQFAVPVRTADHRPSVLTVAREAPSDPSQWGLIARSSAGRYCDTAVLMTKTGGPRLEVSVDGGFHTATVLMAHGTTPTSIYVHVEGRASAPSAP